jgi:hypothetical protein
MKKRTAAILKWTGIVVVVLAVVYSAFLWTANRALERAYAALEEGGHPMTLEEVLPPRVADEDNAALLYDAAISLLKAEPAGDANLFEALSELAGRIAEDEPEPGDHERFMALCQSKAMEGALNLVRRGSRRKGCWYDNNYADGIAVQFPQLSPLRNLSRIIAAKARLTASGGNVREAWDDIAVGLRLANATRHEPTLVGQLVRMAQFAPAARALKVVAAIGPPDEQQHGEIVGLLETFENRAPFVGAMDGERALFGQWLFGLSQSELADLARGKEGDGFLSWLPAYRRFLAPLYIREHAAYLNGMRVVAEFAAERYTPDSAARYEEALRQVIPRHAILMKMLFPAMRGGMLRLQSGITDARVTRVGLVALRHAEAHGAFPQDLDVLKAGNVEDPFTGKPLVYRTTDKGFIIYSVGEDFVDDGGKPIEGAPRKGDIVWEYGGSSDTDS